MGVGYGGYRGFGYAMFGLTSKANFEELGEAERTGEFRPEEGVSSSPALRWKRLNLKKNVLFIILHMMRAMEKYMEIYGLVYGLVWMKGWWSVLRQPGHMERM